MKVGKSIVLDGKMGMRKFWSVALPFGKVACAVNLMQGFIAANYIIFYKLYNIK